MRALQYMRAADAIQNALFYSIMWYTGLRASDAFELRHQQIRKIGSDWRISLTLTKTAKEQAHAHSIKIRDDGHLSNPTRILPAYIATMDSLDLDASQGDIFRAIIPWEEGSAKWGHILSYGPMASRFKQWTDALSLPDVPLLHTFHGSHAAHRLENGDSIPTICREMPWSLETFHHYVTGREVMSMLSDSILPSHNQSRVGGRSA